MASIQTQMVNCIAEAKSRQASKIRELKAALTDAGLTALDEQARSLSLNRSTAWAILRGTHKASGLSAGIIIRMLSAPNLPPVARRKILEYVREKFDGVYGHNTKQLRRFRTCINAYLDDVRGGSSQGGF